jgi:hypothetical protein
MRLSSVQAVRLTLNVTLQRLSKAPAPAFQQRPVKGSPIPPIVYASARDPCKVAQRLLRDTEMSTIPAKATINQIRLEIRCFFKGYCL